MTREEFDDLLLCMMGTPRMAWDTRFRLLREYDRLAEARDGLTEKHQVDLVRVAELMTEVERLTAQVDWLKSRLDEAVLMMITPELAACRAEIERLRAVIGMR